MASYFSSNKDALAIPLLSPGQKLSPAPSSIIKEVSFPGLL